MESFDTNHVKNIVLLGHAGSGKTTLAEAMIFEAGLTGRMGRVEDGTTMSDYHDLEKERGNSIFSSLLHTRWEGFKINIIDTPGYDDFVGEVISALRVADTGVLLLNAKVGVEVGADLIWDYTEEFKTPMILVINHLDHVSADYENVLREAKSHFGSNVLAIQYPVNQGLNFNEIIDTLHMVMYRFANGKTEELPIPESEKERADAMHKELIEVVASNDEELMEKYFDLGELSEEDLKHGIKKAMIHHDIFPLFCTSAKNNIGSNRLMSFIDVVCPSANEMPPQHTVSGDELICNAAGPACIFIFKIISEPHVGELSFFKVYSGTIKAGMELVNENTGAVEKLNQLLLMEGHSRISVNELVAGDIGATLKLKNTHAYNTLHERGQNLELPKIVFPSSNMTVYIDTIKKGEEEKLSQALHSIQEEDDTVKVEVSPELKQTLIHCQGELHLAILKWKIEHQYKLEVVFGQPKIPYRETIRKMAESNYRHKKQSGGSGQFGEVYLRIEPWHEGIPEPAGLNVRNREEHNLAWGGKLVFYNCIVGGAIENRFLPSILKGVMEKMQTGPLTGSYVRDVRVCVYDGKMHPVDSNDISFRIAGLQAFRQAFGIADPQLLEPVYLLEVICLGDQTGSVINDLQTRRGIVEAIKTEGHFQKISAFVPLAEMYGYSSALRSFTKGRAKFSMKFKEYTPVPFELQKTLIEEYKKQNKEVE
ncbi:MAG: elongation factor G [Ferruginibacter sp.]